MKKLSQKVSPALLLSTAFAMLALAGCGQKSEAPAAGGSSDKAAAAPAPTHSIAVIPKGTTHIYWQSVKAGAEAAGKDLGYKIYWNGPERETDRERQIQIIEDFVVQKVDGFVLAPLDRKALIPTVEKLADSKIPCAIVDSAVDTDKVTAYIATDNYQGGALAAKRMGEVLGGKGNVLVVKYVPGSGSTADRENGFIETIQKEFPGIKVVDTKYGQDTVETALQATEDLLTRNQDVQGLFACNASTAVGALQALQSQNRTAIKMVGFDAEKALLDGLKADHIDALIVQNPYKMGYEGVKAVDAALHGKPVEKKQDTGCAVIHKGNLEQPEIKALLSGQ